MMLLSTVCGAVTSSLLVCAVLLLLRTNPNACISPACIDNVLLSSCHDNGSQLKGVDPQNCKQACTVQHKQVITAWQLPIVMLLHTSCSTSIWLLKVCWCVLFYCCLHTMLTYSLPAFQGVGRHSLHNTSRLQRSAAACS
jgi:hypothetical protein